MTVRTNLGEARLAAALAEFDKRMVPVDHVTTSRVGERNTARQVFEDRLAMYDSSIALLKTNVDNARDAVDKRQRELITYLKAQNQSLRQEIEGKDQKLADQQRLIDELREDAGQNLIRDPNFEEVELVKPVTADDVVKAWREGLASLSGFVGFQQTNDKSGSVQISADQIVPSPQGEQPSEDSHSKYFLLGTEAKLTFEDMTVPIVGVITAALGDHRTLRSYSTGLSYTATVDKFSHVTGEPRS